MSMQTQNLGNGKCWEALSQSEVPSGGEWGELTAKYSVGNLSMGIQFLSDLPDSTLDVPDFHFKNTTGLCWLTEKHVFYKIFQEFLFLSETES